MQNSSSSKFLLDFASDVVVNQNLTIQESKFADSFSLHREIGLSPFHLIHILGYFQTTGSDTWMTNCEAAKLFLSDNRSEEAIRVKCELFYNHPMD